MRGQNTKFRRGISRIYGPDQTKFLGEKYNQTYGRKTKHHTIWFLRQIAVCSTHLTRISMFGWVFWRDRGERWSGRMCIHYPFRLLPKLSPFSQVKLRSNKVCYIVYSVIPHSYSTTMRTWYTIRVHNVRTKFLSIIKNAMLHQNIDPLWRTLVKSIPSVRYSAAVLTGAGRFLLIGAW